MKQISYLKSFKVQDEDDEELEEEQQQNNDLLVEGNSKKKVKNYFHYIRYAIQNASSRSNHVNMKPCYGFDLTPSSGHLLDYKGGFIETSLPLIKPPYNDFHFHLFNNR